MRLKEDLSIIEENYGCFVDQENGTECVMDRKKTDDGIEWDYDDCFFAKRLHAEGRGKTFCKYWRTKEGDHWDDGLAFAIRQAETEWEAYQDAGMLANARAMRGMTDWRLPSARPKQSGKPIKMPACWLTPGQCELLSCFWMSTKIEKHIT